MANCSFLNNPALYIGTYESEGKYNPIYLFSSDVIAFSDTLSTSVSVGSTDSNVIIFSDIKYTYVLNDNYYLQVGVNLNFNDDKLNMGYEYGVGYSVSSKMNVKLITHAVGPFFDGHDYGILLGIESKL